MTISREVYDHRLKKLPDILQCKPTSLMGYARSQNICYNCPKSLKELALETLDRQPLPECVFWENNRVVQWVEETVQLPQYSVCFRANFVKGRELIYIEPNQLVKMNIWKHEHITKIMDEIRKLYGVGRPKFSHDLTKLNIFGSEYEWLILYYRTVGYQTPTNAMSKSEFWREFDLADENVKKCHWENIRTGADQSHKVIIARVTPPNPNRMRHFAPTFPRNSILPTTNYRSFLLGDRFTL